MTTTGRWILSVAAVLAAAAAGGARGEVSYAYATDAAEYRGGAVSVRVYLEETLTEGSPSLLGTDGLGAAAFKVARVAGSGFAIADVTYNSAFAGDLFNRKSVAPEVASLQEVIGFADETGVPFESPGRVFLGTIEIAGGGEPATFELQLYDEKVGNVSTFSWVLPIALDDPSNPGFRALQAGQRFVVGVPEPASLAAVILGSVGLLRRRRAKWQAGG